MSIGWPLRFCVTVIAAVGVLGLRAVGQLDEPSLPMRTMLYNWYDGMFTLLEDLRYNKVQKMSKEELEERSVPPCKPGQSLPIQPTILDSDKKSSELWEKLVKENEECKEAFLQGTTLLDGAVYPTFKLETATISDLTTRRTKTSETHKAIHSDWSTTLESGTADFKTHSREMVEINSRTWSINTSCFFPSWVRANIQLMKPAEPEIKEPMLRPIPLAGKSRALPIQPTWTGPCETKPPTQGDPRPEEPQGEKPTSESQPEKNSTIESEEVKSLPQEEVNQQRTEENVQPATVMGKIAGSTMWSKWTRKSENPKLKKSVLKEESPAALSSTISELKPTVTIDTEEEKCCEPQKVDSQNPREHTENNFDEVIHTLLLN